MAQPEGRAPKGGKPWRGCGRCGRVVRVDYTTRTVILQGPGGRMATANGKNARHLDQGKVGNTVKRKWPSLYGKADAVPQGG